jgi:hypothetical protein
MTIKEVTPALSSDALLGKSKKYIQRALAAKSRKEMAEYQLWASLALELLGKSVLAQIHPCLIADPQSYVSLFAAAGMNIGTDVKTITAKTVFERLSHISKRFDTKTQEYCEGLSLKRNAELHSGEAPFEALIPTTLEGRFWYTIEVILEIRHQTIDDWLGNNQAQTPKELLSEFVHAVTEASKVRVATARENFQKLKKGVRDAAHARAAGMGPGDAWRNFRPNTEGVWEADCPACGSKAFLAGVEFTQEELDEYDPDFPYEEIVEIALIADEFYCPACELKLRSREEIQAIGMDIGHIVTETRQREYEPEYGND